MNIASVPWRCGQSCACGARRAGRGRASRSPASTAGVSSARSARMPGERRGDDLARLGEVRRARDVGEEPAGRERRDGGIEQLRLQARRARRRRSGCLRQRASGRRRSAPRPVQGASSRMRSNRSGVSVAEAPAVALDDLGRRVEHREGVAHEPRPASGPARSRRGSPRRAPPPPRAAPPCRPGPAHRSSQRSPAAIGRARLSASAASCEPSSCTRARPLATTGSCRRVAARPTARRPARRRPGSPTSSRRIARPGSATRLTAGRDVVGREQLLELALAALGGERVAERRDDPVADASTRPRAARRRSSPASSALAPLLGRRPGDGAQHAVDEARRRRLAAPTRPARPTRRRRRAAATRIDEQLVDAQPQRVEHLRRRSARRGRSTASAMTRS